MKIRLFVKLKKKIHVFHSWALGKFSQQDDSVMINLLTAVMLIRISLSKSYTDESKYIYKPKTFPLSVQDWWPGGATNFY